MSLSEKFPRSLWILLTGIVQILFVALLLIFLKFHGLIYLLGLQYSNLLVVVIMQGISVIVCIIILTLFLIALKKHTPMSFDRQIIASIWIFGLSVLGFFRDLGMEFLPTPLIAVILCAISSICKVAEIKKEDKK